MSHSHNQHSTAQFRVGIDVGGTFTDVVCLDDDGNVQLTKIPTTRRDPSVAVRHALEHMTKQWDVAPSQIEHFIHGTTVATNAVLERKGAKIGLITTEGFKDALEIGRQNRSKMYNMILSAETPVFIAPGARRKEVRERISRSGEVIVPLDEAALVDAVDALANDGVEAIAVCFLFSFINPVHELRTREIIATRHPSVMVSLSSEVDPAFREYERTVATAFDAYVKPVLDRYLGNMEQYLGDAGVPATLQVMQSRGGICSSATARRRPIRMFLSGPAAGVIGGRMVGQEVGRDQLITVDIGGTSCDISVISSAEPLVRDQGVVDGYPVRVPMVDVNAIGAGGGSIARLDTAGGLRVGPESAGSEPGPACYGLGGEEPTVTDASVVLGYIDPGNFAGGALVLRPELARRAIEEKIAKPMSISVEAAALGIHRVINAQMVEGIRLVSIRRGFDPRNYSLVALGGGGAIHATALAAELGMTTVIVPRNPGVLCAYGLLAAPIEHEMSTAFPCELATASLAAIKEILCRLDHQLEELMQAEGVAAPEVIVRHMADVCYVGQSYHLEVPFEDDGDRSALERLYQDFLDKHATVYGHSTRAPAKIVNLRSVHRTEVGNVASSVSAISGGKTRPKGWRRILAGDGGAAVETPIYERTEIRGDADILGPAVIEQIDTTIVVQPGWRARLSAGANLLLMKDIG